MQTIEPTNLMNPTTPWDNVIRWIEEFKEPEEEGHRRHAKRRAHGVEQQRALAHVGRALALVNRRLDLLRGHEPDEG